MAPRPAISVSPSELVKNVNSQMLQTQTRFPQWLSGREATWNAGDKGDAGSIPGLGRSPGGGNGSPLKYSCLGNPMTEEPRRPQSIGLQRV